jgi:hypothetical protein
VKVLVIILGKTTSATTMLVSTDKVRKQELVSTKPHLASDKSTEDNNMACELVKTNAALLNKGSTRSEDEDTANFKHEAIGYTTKTVTTMVVPTMNPFSRKKKTVLNPGSCSSAINLLNAMSLSSNVTIGGSSIFDDNKSSSSTVSYYHRAHKSQRTKKVLNPGSCASGLNFMFDTDFDDSQQRVGSMSDITFWFGGGGDNNNNHAPSSSLPRQSSSLTTTTSRGLRRSRKSITSSTRFNDNGKRNAEWGEFK